jgi:hypothetical protein
MPHAQIEVFLRCKMRLAGHKRLPERPIIGPFGKDFVNGRVMDGRVAMGVFRHGQTLPLHPGVEHPQDEVKDAMIAQFALWTPLWPREVRQDKFRELRCRELDGNWRGGRVCSGWTLPPESGFSKHDNSIGQCAKLATSSIEAGTAATEKYSWHCQLVERLVGSCRVCHTRCMSIPPTNPYTHHRFPAKIISHAVW